MTIFRLNFLLKVGQMKVCQNPSFISTITMTKPLQVELFWQKRRFLPGVPKLKPFWPKHTVLSKFCQNKVISVKTHSFKQLLLKSSYFGQNHCFKQLLTK